MAHLIALSSGNKKTSILLWAIVALLASLLPAPIVADGGDVDRVEITYTRDGIEVVEEPVARDGNVVFDIGTPFSIRVVHGEPGTTTLSYVVKAAGKEDIGSSTDGFMVFKAGPDEVLLALQGTWAASADGGQSWYGWQMFEAKASEDDGDDTGTELGGAADNGQTDTSSDVGDSGGDTQPDTSSETVAAPDDTETDTGSDAGDLSGDAQSDTGSETVAAPDDTETDTDSDAGDSGDETQTDTGSETGTATEDSQADTGSAAGDTGDEAQTDTGSETSAADEVQTDTGSETGVTVDETQADTGPETGDGDDRSSTLRDTAVVNITSTVNLYYACEEDEIGVDTDGDGLADCQEETAVPALIHNPIDKWYIGEKIHSPTYANNPDSDGDRLSDAEELLAVFGYRTDPRNPDHDADGLTDFDEVKSFHTDPTNADTDGDGVNDAEEILRGRDPTVSDKLLTKWILGPLGDVGGWLNGGMPVWLLAPMFAFLLFLSWSSDSGVSSTRDGDIRETRRLRDQVKTAEEEKSKAQASFNRARTEWATVNRKLNDLRDTAEEKDREARKERKTIEDRTAERDSARGELERLQQEAADLVEARGQLPSLQGHLQETQKELVDLAEGLGEQIAPTLAELPVVDPEQPWAMRDRQEVLQTLLGELQEQKRQFYDPSMSSSKAHMKTLEDAGIDTAIYKESLEFGNVGATLIVERILKDLVDKLDEARKGVNKELLKDLDGLEKEVNEKVVDVRLRVVPRGLIRYARELATKPSDPSEVKTHERTVESIIGVIREYVS